MTITDDFEQDGQVAASYDLKNNNIRHRKTGSDDSFWNRKSVTYAPKLPKGFEGRKLIGIRGNWYDVTNFIQHHPGGPIIENFIGKDATQPFRGFHEKEVLKHRKPVARYELPTSDPATEKFSQLHDYFIQEGFFITSHKWYAMKFSVALIELAACVGILYHGHSLLHLLSAAIALFLFWQQCGFFMHDFEHSQWFHEPKWDYIAGTIAGTVGVGIDGSWWREEHFVHHALLNTVNYVTGFHDPQMVEDLWAQSEKLFPLFQRKIQWLLIKVQWITFIPICVCVGRIGIILDGFRKERRWYEWLAFAVHWMWMGAVLSLIPNWSDRFTFYASAAILEGILHVQLLISHYSKPWVEEQNVCVNMDWYRVQVESNINIDNHPFLDWFHGGLNFHIEHHLFPRMPRHNYRRASKHVRRVCKELGMEYDSCGWFTAIYRTLGHLKKMSKHFSLDPR